MNIIVSVFAFIGVLSSFVLVTYTIDRLRNRRIVRQLCGEEWLRQNGYIK